MAKEASKELDQLKAMGLPPAEARQAHELMKARGLGLGGLLKLLPLVLEYLPLVEEFVRRLREAGVEPPQQAPRK
jgi:hypothetical protein